MPHETTDWKAKLLALLHDPPHKPFRIAGHEDARASALIACGLSVEEMEAWEDQQRMNPDWLAAAADRFPFPKAEVLFVDWKTHGGLEFRHPLAGTRLVPPNQPRERSAVGEDWVNRALSGIPTDDVGWKAKFFRLWRFWPERCARDHNPLLAHLVADTRIPDHTLWHHNGLVSALETAGPRPAFLQFQIGPVQDFIRQGRKMQDLWSGSYLLSFLISKALATVALEIGPDAIVYPSLRGVPLLDWWWSKEVGLFHDGAFELGQGRLHPHELLTPSLPNRFLALVPGGEAGHRIAQAAENAVRKLWSEVADAVHADLCQKLQNHLGQDRFPLWDSHWREQTKRFPVVDWVVHAWLPEMDAVNSAAADSDPVPPLFGGWPNHPLCHARKWRDMIPSAHREAWHGRRNDAFAWPLHCAGTDWKFAARKNARPFAAWAHPQSTPRHLAKDPLNGRDEVLGGPQRDEFWTELREVYGGAQRGHFKGKQQYGAITVIKRLWPQCFLKEKLQWRPWKPSFDSVQDIARAIDKEPDQPLTGDDPTYYAVLCMDGDDMGQWVAGTKTPPLHSVLAQKAWDYFKNGKNGLGGWNPEAAGGLDAEGVHRPPSPGYHAALSEALSNFSLYCAGQIVEAFNGQMLFSGGDDVLAMLPAEQALDCAQALQYAFQGQVPPDAPQRVKQVLENLFEFPATSSLDNAPRGGFIRCKRSSADEAHRPNWPLLVPGPRATASVGIAIGHVRSPMQDTIQAAREAETAAKAVPHKGAFCLSILKRSGEAVSFAARFHNDVGAVWSELEANLDRLSARFPYRFLQLIQPLLTRSGSGSDHGWESRWTADLIHSAEAELRHVHFQQSESGEPAETRRRRAREQAARWMRLLVGPADKADDPTWEPALSPRHFAQFWMAWAFVNRLKQQPEDDR